MGSSLIKEGFQITAHLPCKHFLCPDFFKTQCYFSLNSQLRHCVGGIVVSIAAFQAVGPGSIPGRRNLLSDLGNNYES